VIRLTPKERELRQQLAAKLEEARALLEEGKLEEARAAKDAAAALKEQIDTLEELRELQASAQVDNRSTISAPAVHVEKPAEEREKAYRDAFIAMLRGTDLTAEQRSLLQERRAMNSTSGQDGGFLIPPDIQTRINEIKRQYIALEDYVTTEAVSTLTGSRVLEKYVDITPFANIAAENTTLPDLDNPKVSQVTFNIKDYGGILTLTNNLLNDSPENIMAYVATWIARKDIITDNSLILSVLQTFTTKSFAGLDDVKKTLNVDLDPMLAQNAIVVTNQDGYNHLDQQKDTMGRYLLQPDPTQPDRKLLFGKPVVVMANRLLPTDTQNNAAPFIVGDLKSAVVVFDRQEISILTTNIGGQAFETNTTKMRVIIREDVKAWDTGAAVYGSLALE
jgi:HK97 family phage major capsid protein